MLEKAFLARLLFFYFGFFPPFLFDKRPEVSTSTAKIN